MKTSAQVIRVSAAPSRDRVPSLSSWLDSVQVRPHGGKAFSGRRAEEEDVAVNDAAPAAELSDFVTFKIL